MAVPKFEEFLYPFLCQLKDKDVSLKDMKEALAKHFSLSKEDCALTTSKGNKTQLNDRIGWSFQYLRRAQMVENAGRGVYHITERGLEYLRTHKSLYKKDLREFPEFVQFDSHGDNKKIETTDVEEDIIEEKTPTEQLEQAFAIINDTLAEELLQKTLNMDPTFFEHLVVDLLLAMGYGDPTDGSAMVTQRSHDNGIDGIIPQDKLGLDKIYIQAKRYAPQNTVQSKELREFIGALAEKKASKGVFITTSSFTSGAKQTASGTSMKIVLIDGKQLVRYMIDYNVGVSTKKTYVVKKLDQDYFEE